jgi:hypothetical protein
MTRYGGQPVHRDNAPSAAQFTTFHTDSYRLKAVRSQLLRGVPGLRAVAGETVVALVNALLLEVGFRR